VHCSRVCPSANSSIKPLREGSLDALLRF